MTTKRRMPPLTMDEVILLVDTYFCLQEVENKDTKEEMIVELSNGMRSLPFYQELRDDPSFRSVDGMKMCLANVAWADPSTNCKFGHGSISQRKVLEYYTNRKADLHANAIAIKKVASLDYPIMYEYNGFIGGVLLPSFHNNLERTSKTIKAVLKEAGNQRRTKCLICRQDLSDIYGECASALIELHINVPFPHNTPGIDVSPSDLILLCPTCHKLAHSNPQYFETDKLQSAIKAGL